MEQRTATVSAVSEGFPTLFPEFCGVHFVNLKLFKVLFGLF
jgi:hypothetical protein